MKKKKRRKYTNGSKRIFSAPAKYQEGFLEKMDYRTTLYNNLDKSFKQVVRDLGGKDGLSRLEISLCERFVFCEFLIRKLEVEMANANNGKTEEYLERWTKLSNSINSIVNKLGVPKRRPDGQSELSEILKEEN